jgi:hypothetical protein
MHNKFLLFAAFLASIPLCSGNEITTFQEIPHESKKRIFDYLPIHDQLVFRLLDKHCNSIFNIMFDHFDPQKNNNNHIAELLFAAHCTKRFSKKVTPENYINICYCHADQIELPNAIGKKFRAILKQGPIDKKKLLETSYNLLFTRKTPKELSAPCLKKEAFSEQLAPFLSWLIDNNNLSFYQQFFYFLVTTLISVPLVNQKNIENIVTVILRKNKKGMAKKYLLPIISWLETKRDWRSLEHIGFLIQEKNDILIINKILASLYRIKRLFAAGKKAREEQNPFYLNILQYCLKKKIYSPLSKIISITIDTISAEGLNMLRHAQGLIEDEVKKLEQQKKNTNISWLKKLRKIEKKVCDRNFVLKYGTTFPI